MLKGSNGPSKTLTVSTVTKHFYSKHLSIPGEVFFKIAIQCKCPFCALLFSHSSIETITMTDQTESSLPKRVVRTITLTEEDLNMLDEVERVLSKTGHRVKTDSKLIRAAINVASRVLHGKSYDVNEIAEKVVREDGRSLSKLIAKKNS